MGATADFIAVLAGSAESKAVATLLMGIIAMIAARLMGGAEWSTLALVAVVVVALSKRFAAGGVNTAKPNMKGKIVVITGAATGEWMGDAGARQRVAAAAERSSPPASASPASWRLCGHAADAQRAHSLAQLCSCARLCGCLCVLR